VSTTSRGYGRVHQVMRARLAPLVEAGETFCSLCRRRIHPEKRGSSTTPSTRAATAGQLTSSAIAPRVGRGARRSRTSPASRGGSPECGDCACGRAAAGLGAWGFRRAFGRAIRIAARARHVVRALDSYALLVVGPRPPRLRRLRVVRTLDRRVINDISVQEDRRHAPNVARVGSVQGPERLRKGGGGLGQSRVVDRVDDPGR
jgi:hypothetical protein